jgi:hypothetical protein
MESLPKPSAQAQNMNNNSGEQLKYGIGPQYESARYFSNANDQKITNNTFTGLFISKE